MGVFFIFFIIVCFTSNCVFSIAVFPHSPGVVDYHLLLRRETRIPGVAPLSFRIGIWDLFVHMGQKSYTPTAFEKLWTIPRVRCMNHASSLSMIICVYFQYSYTGPRFQCKSACTLKLWIIEHSCSKHVVI